MPSNYVKPGEEDEWERAKKLAADQGQKDNYAYITSIFKSLTGKKESVIRSYHKIFKEQVSISLETAMKVGEKLGIDFSEINIEEFRKGLEVEQEHGNISPETDVIPDIGGGDDLLSIGKVALAHLNELPDYYTRLDQMEQTP